MKVKHLQLSKGVSNSIYNLLIDLKNNPYKEYPKFRDEITGLIRNNLIPKEFLNISREVLSDRKTGTTYAHLLKDCPIDKVRPIFDHDNPVEDKYNKKKTFVGEGFLELISQLWDITLWHMKLVTMEISFMMYTLSRNIQEHKLKKLIVIFFIIMTELHTTFVQTI